MIGVFPPPYHGLSLINLLMRDYFASRGIKAAIFNLSPRELGRSWRIKIFRCMLVLRRLIEFCKFCIIHRDASVYMSISAGFGQVYEIIFLFLCCMRGYTVFLHHHSFIYLNSKRPALLMKLIELFSANFGYHIVLSEIMAKKLHFLYPSLNKMIILSNSGLLLIEPPKSSRCFNPSFTIGFLSNIEKDKGIFEFLELVQYLESDSNDIRALIAGPFIDIGTENIVLNKIADFRNVEYLGPIYDEKKEAFWKNIDVLIYPTKNDAEPLTVLEALANGVPVLTRSIGCIPEMISSSNGEAFGENENFVDSAALKIRLWLKNPQDYESASRNAYKSYAAMKSKAKEALESLYDAIKTRTLS